ncbi:MAG: class II fructose-bisphosphate aldolase [Patescibacteria group bacterium]
MTKKLIEYIKEAEQSGVAIGHFNISNSEILSGILAGARKLNLPVVIGLSEGERDFLGMKQAVALVRSYKDEFDYPVFINADHTYSIEKAKEAIDAGVDSIVVDGSKLTLDENIKLTKECVQYARNKNPEILVEAEIGYIGGSSKILDDIPLDVSLEDDDLPTPSDAKRLVEESGADMLAPAVGNVHGMLRVEHDPKLNIGLIKKMRDIVGVPLILHGGSGDTDEDFKKAIKAGISMVHINTEIRVAFKDGLKMSLQEYPEEVAPYKLMKEAVKMVEKKVVEKMSLFNNL